MNVAVIGGGAAGLAAAYGLRNHHRVTLFEKAPQLGGHALTVEVPDGPDAGTPLDVGFMVLNARNYPLMHALLGHLDGVAFGASEMSFSYHSRAAGFSYGLNFDAHGPERPVVPLLAEIVRFMRHATRDLAEDTLGTLTLGEYFTRRGFSDDLITRYLLPMGAAIWSAEPDGVREAPAAFVLGFYHHHGMLSLKDPPAWQHVRGGSRTYVEAIRRALGDGVRAGAAVTQVSRTPSGAVVTTEDGEAAFDAVVLATHANQALALLTDPSAEEETLLGAWRYQANAAVLHTDPALLPEDRAVWASWNFHWEPEARGHGPVVTYYLNRLQGHEAAQRDYFLTLNPLQDVADAHVLARFDFTHPIYDAESVATQVPLAALSGTRQTFFCGNYLGYGFHEDAIRSGWTVARALGGGW